MANKIKFTNQSNNNVAMVADDRRPDRVKWTEAAEKTCAASGDKLFLEFASGFSSCVTLVLTSFGYWTEV